MRLRNSREYQRAHNGEAEEAEDVEEGCILDLRIDPNTMGVGGGAEATLSMDEGAVEVKEKAQAIGEDMLQRKARGL